MPLERLREYRTETAEPVGLDDWWAQRLERARAQAQPAIFTPYETDVYRPYQVHDVEFSGAGGDPIRAWYLKPSGTKTPSVVVKFIGYGGGRGSPTEHLLLPALGYGVLVMDSRGQGGRWTYGATGDAAVGAENSAVMTRGITTPDDYYFTRLFTDAARAVDVALELSGGAPVAVSGHSGRSRWRRPPRTPRSPSSSRRTWPSSTPRLTRCGTWTARCSPAGSPRRHCFPLG
jgi:cephalosporin-C deacetylase